MAQSASSSPSVGRGWRARLGFGLAWWVVLAGLWLLLVESFAPAELAAGAVAAALAASVAEAVREGEYVTFAPALAWLRYGPRVAWQILADCWILAVALAHHLRGDRLAHGLVTRVPMRYGDDGGRDAARRALLNFGISITPNSYVIDFDGELSMAVIHQLVPGPPDPLLGEHELGPDVEPPSEAGR